MAPLKNWDNKTWLSSMQYISSFKNFLKSNTEISKNSKVLDPCAGTGGFLISAMHRMFKKASTSSEKNLIKSKGLVGVEDQPHMYALAASNMILRGDGKANLIQGDSFNKSVIL